MVFEAGFNRKCAISTNTKSMLIKLNGNNGGFFQKLSPFTQQSSELGKVKAARKRKWCPHLSYTIIGWPCNTYYLTRMTFL